MIEDATCDYCLAECPGAYSTYLLLGASEPHKFCRQCLDPEAPLAEQQTRGRELLIAIMDRAAGEGGNTLQLPGHA